MRILAAIFCLAACGATSTVLAQSDEVTARINRLERALENKGLLELVRQVDQLQQEVRRLRGELETQTYNLEQLRKGQRDVYTSVDQRLSTLEQGGTISLPPDGQIGAGTTPPLPTLSGPGDSGVAGTPAGQSWALDVQGSTDDSAADGTVATDRSDQPPVGVYVVPGAARSGANAGITPNLPQVGPDEGDPSLAADPALQQPGELQARRAPRADDAVPTTSAASNSQAADAAYRDAFTKLKAGQYEESIAAFNAYLQEYPGGQYADNAQYWLGEAYYVMRQFEPAIEQYQQLLANYPDSQKQSHAMLKIAYSFAELDLDEQALGVLEDLKSRFPGSAAARLADERIQRLRAQAP
ncbi:MAG: tol-pal system protein YbgF [Gammaproteobacteria bacterium]